MVFIDSNIPMYLIGAPHPHKVDAQRLVEQLIAATERLVCGFDGVPGVTRIA
jgi:predicted nucleic acid-binding protein